MTTTTETTKDSAIETQDIHQRHWQAYAAHENTLRAALYSCTAVVVAVVASATAIMVTW